MKLTRGQKEARLRASADGIIAALLAWDEEQSAPSLTEMEDTVLELRRRMGQELLAVLVAGQELSQPAENPRCPACAGEMRYKGQKGRGVESRVGGLKVERGYYYCACCESGFFPPGPATGVGARVLE